MHYAYSAFKLSTIPDFEHLNICLQYLRTDHQTMCVYPNNNTKETKTLTCKILYRVFHNEWYKSFCLFLRLWCIFRSKTCCTILMTLGHFGAYRLKVLVENFYFWFSPAFKIVKFIEPAENTLKKWNILTKIPFWD